ncbi:uncharacterized protein [Chelonus insularis]|uniref:uncharacterized protein n=1 Tax=Chelonus insularis TaxID=460826 RepID=UPI001588B955|nr:uncharacterized protein LOC118073470 [Chelonus insularis]
MGDCDKSNLPEQNNKRRSELFHRRSSIKPSENCIDDITEDCNSSNEKKLDSPKLSEEPFDLSKHIQTLKNEKEMWKREYEERRAKRKLLKKQETRTKCVANLELLPENERNFLLARPDYAQLSQKIKKLQPIATQIACLNTEINHRSKTLIDYMEEKIRLTAERIANENETKEVQT